MRILLKHYMACEKNILMEDQDFRDLLIEDGGPILGDFLDMIKESAMDEAHQRLQNDVRGAHMGTAIGRAAALSYAKLVTTSSGLCIRTEVSMALCPSELALGRYSPTCPDVKAGRAQWWNVHIVGQWSGSHICRNTIQRTREQGGIGFRCSGQTHSGSKPFRDDWCNTSLSKVSRQLYWSQ